MNLTSGSFELEYEYCRAPFIETGAVVLTGIKGAGFRLEIPERIDDRPVTEIGKKAFLGLSGLREVLLPRSIRALGDYSFAQCVHLSKFTLPCAKDVSFGKGIFKGCERLSDILIGYEQEDDLSKMMAVAVITLNAAHLLRGSDVGTTLWYEAFDQSLLHRLSESDYALCQDQVLCGEEDISYDGAYSVDGEMPGESAAGLMSVRKKKCRIALLRLMHPAGLKDAMRDQIEAYLKTAPVWECLKEYFPDELDYYRLYLELVRPDAAEREKLICDLGSAHPQVKAYLISASLGQKRNSMSNNSGNETEESGDFLDELMI